MERVQEKDFQARQIFIHKKAPRLSEFSLIPTHALSAPAADAAKWSSLNSQARNALGCQFVAMVLGFLSTLVLGQGVLGTVVAVGTLLIFVLPAVMTVVIETTALRELSGQMTEKLAEAADEEAQVTESPLRVDDAGES